MTDTMNIFESAVRDVNGGDHDSFTTFEAVGGNGDLWVQYKPGNINALYPFDDAPESKLATFKFDAVLEWLPNAYVTLEYFFEPTEVAAWIDRYFREILGCEAGYKVDVKSEL